jgi:cobalt/nickel transport system permease protein
MHMADALLAPAVGGLMWLAAGTALAVAGRRVGRQPDDRLVPLMGMLGAFVFAAQMVNFAIPGTGSSGHLGGGLLLALLLGPWPALVVMASVLTVQALIFADGGLLALGANIFNLGVLPCLVVLPLVYRPLAGPAPSSRRLSVAVMLSAIAGLLLGATGVVLQTVASGVSSLPLQAFAWMMLPIHAAIGIVEGLATLALVLFLRRHRPDLLQAALAAPGRTLRPALLGWAMATALLGGAGSWFASTAPDGLEWSVQRTSVGHEAAAPAAGPHTWLARLQQRTALLPDYDLPAPHSPAANQAEAPPWPAIKAGTSLAGLLGGVATLTLVLGVGWALRRRQRLAAQRAG